MTSDHADLRDVLKRILARCIQRADPQDRAAMLAIAVRDGHFDEGEARVIALACELTEAEMDDEQNEARTLD